MPARDGKTPLASRFASFAPERRNKSIYGEDNHIMLSDQLLTRVAAFLARETGRDADVLLFGLRLFWTSFSGYATLIAVGALLGILPHALIAGVTAAVLRVFSGGAHASSPGRCNLIGVTVFVALGLVVKFHGTLAALALKFLFPGLALIGLAIAYKYVPADTPGKPITSRVQKRYLRAVTFSLLLLWGVGGLLWVLGPLAGIFSPEVVLSMSLGLAWQLFTLTPLGYRVVEGVDSLLKIACREGRCQK